MTDKKDTYRIRINHENGSIDYVLPLGTIAHQYPIVRVDDIPFVPLSALTLIEILSESGLCLECVEYPKQGNN